MSTIKDIAAMAGVAPSTVSNVLNGSKYVSSEIQERVNQVMKTTKFSPNVNARSLRTNRTGLIGVVVPNLSNFFFSEIICALDEELSSEGFSIVLCSYHNDRKTELECIQKLMKRGIDGLVLLCAGTQFDQSPIVSDIPIITIDRKQNYPCYTILVDNIEGGYLATSFLCKRKRSRILLLTDIVKSDPFFERLIGYRKALAEYCISYNENFIFENPISFSNGSQLMQKIIDSKLIFDAIFSASYYTSMGIMRALALNKINVPNDVALVSYDNPPASAYTYPALTTIQQPTEDMGRAAAKALISNLRGETTSTPVQTLKPILIERETA